MFAELERVPYNAAELTRAPDAPGVYILWEGTEITFVGTASRSIRGALADRLAKFGRPCGCLPTHCSWVASNQVESLERALLQIHLRLFQALPRCNQPRLSQRAAA